jgi:hypothetical protein
MRICVYVFLYEFIKTTFIHFWKKFNEVRPKYQVLTREPTAIT